MHTLFTLLILLCCTFTYAQVPANFASHSTNKSGNSNFQQKKNHQIKHGLFETDFDLVGGLILVDAELDGTTEQFVLDTGAPHLFLNTKNRLCKKSKQTIIGVGGQQRLDLKKNTDIKWSGKEVNRKRTYGLDLSHIENAKDKKIGGLIGYDMVKNKELVIDYKAQKLYLISKKNKTFFSGHEKVDRIFFRMVGHIPVVRVKFGKKSFYFGIDTGAEVNVIDKRLKGKIPEELLSNISSTKVMGVNEEKERAEYATIKSTKVGKHTYDEMQFIFADLSSFKQSGEFQLDGFLGYSFLKQANFSIDYRKNQLVRWQPKAPEKGLKYVRVED